jgi:hydrogenase expression/formation protein HypC
LGINTTKIYNKFTRFKQENNEKTMCLAIPGKIISITGDDPLMRSGKVSFGGVLKNVSLAYVPEAKVGDYAIIHVGFAISLINEEEAQNTLDDLQKIAS